MMRSRVRQRRSIRLKDHDYASPGAYFVTILVRNRECLLGEVAADGIMRLNRLGQVVRAEWEALPARLPLGGLDQYVIMPNHLHGLIWLRGAVAGVAGDRAADAEGGKGEASAVGGSVWTGGLLADASPLRTDRSQRPHGTQPGSLGAIVQNFKSVSTRRLNAMRQTPGGPFWQRNYWEHVVRDEQELSAIRRYIRENPLKWVLDRDNPANTRRMPAPATMADYLKDLAT